MTNAPNPSRRALCAGLVAAPLAAIPTVGALAADATPDPIFAAIDAYRAALADARAADAIIRSIDAAHPAIEERAFALVTFRGETIDASKYTLADWLARRHPDHLDGYTRRMAEVVGREFTPPASRADELRRWHQESQVAIESFTRGEHEWKKLCAASGYDAACDESDRLYELVASAERAVLTCPPTTANGAQALVAFVALYLAERSSGDWSTQAPVSALKAALEVMNSDRGAANV